MVRRALLAAALLVALAAFAAEAGTWKVGRLPNDCDGPCDFCDTCTPGSQFGGGIDAALSSVSVVSGDTVLVWPGSVTGTNAGYLLRLTMLSGVKLIAKGYPDSVVTIRGTAGAETALRWTGCNELTGVYGFHFTWDSQFTGVGGALAIFVSSGTVQDNIFENCKAGIGAGIYLQSSDVHVVNNLFVNSTALALGGGGGVVAVSGGAPLIEGNTFYTNIASFGNEASVLYGTGSNFTFRNNIIVDSRGAAAIYCGGGNQPVIECNLFFDNELAGFGGQCPDSTGTANNFLADPLLCNPAISDFGLCIFSPAFNHPSCGRIGFVSPFGDCGSCTVPTSANAGLESASWGRVKVLYR
jgi:hypothetical protein